MQHRITLTKTIIIGILLTAINYIAGIILIDMYNMKYAWFGLLIVPLSFALKYLLNFYWVFVK